MLLVLQLLLMMVVMVMMMTMTTTDRCLVSASNFLVHCYWNNIIREHFLNMKIVTYAHLAFLFCSCFLSFYGNCVTSFIHISAYCSSLLSIYLICYQLYINDCYDC